MSLGLYAGKASTVADLTDGAQIAVPNDTTNEACALLLLQQEGLITLKEGAGINATKADIVENPKNLDIVELEANQLPVRLQDVDMAVINGNYAIDAGLNVADALAIEDSEGEAGTAYANVLVVKKATKTMTLSRLCTPLCAAMKSGPTWKKPTAARSFPCSKQSIPK